MRPRVLRVECADRAGLVHGITGVLLARRANVVGNHEFVDRAAGRFFMRTEFELPEDVGAGGLEEEVRSVLPPGAVVQVVGTEPRRIVLMASREHHCLADLLVRGHFGEFNAGFVGVVSNHALLGSLARRFDVPFHEVPSEGLEREEHEARVLGVLEALRPDWIVLAKYMRVLTPAFVGRYPSRILNIHHSFLPAFVGARPYHQAFERGVKVIGATAHIVTDDLDAGPIVVQQVLPVDHTRSASDLARAGRDVEQLALAQALRLVLEDRVFLCGNRTFFLGGGGGGGAAMPFLEFHGVGKGFPGVRALEGVSFGVEKGSCHALMGENGAGKSTLGKILAGVQAADAGRIILDGREIAPRSPLEARAAGIAMVHQELAFCPNLSVAENLALGDMPSVLGWVDRRRLEDRARAMLREVGADIDPRVPVGQLGTGQEQLVQVAAAVGTGARVIVMDEPTSSLSVAEAANLFGLVRRLQERGITLLYVSHRMDEIFRLCDAITVLRDGRHVATQRARDVSHGELVRQMVGREVALHDEPVHVGRPLGEEVLRVRGLSSPGKFRDVSLVLRRGEVVGMAGLVGAGRSEVAQAIFGLDPRATGEVEACGRRVRPGHPGDALAAGMGLLPEDRKRQGLVLSMNCRENTSLAVLGRLSRGGLVDGGRERALAGDYARRLDLRAPGIDAGVAGLSGGNQQKVALAKWLARECSVLLVDEPTRGVDVGAKAEIHRLLDELACQGMAILLVSSELPEVMALSRRILVMRQGRVEAEVPRAGFGADALMRWMAGVGDGADG